MLGSYLKIIFRVLWRNRFYSLINILGLAVGIACSILLYLYIRHELSYDRFYPEHEQVYRVNMHFEVSKQQEQFFYASAGYGFAPNAQAKCSEFLEASCRLFRGTSEKPITYAERKLFLSNLLYAEPSYFKVFPQKFLQGKAENLAEANTMILTRSAAKEIFGSVRAAYGKVIQVFDYQHNKVVGIIEDLPSNTHFQLSGLISFATIENIEERSGELQWSSLNYPTFLRLKAGVSLKSCQTCLDKEILPLILQELNRINFEAQGGFYLQALKDIHLPEVHYQDEFADTNQRYYIFIFLSVALFILLVACINYMNLATARSVSRAKEVGMRKVLGAQRWQLIIQFLLESFLLVIISLVFALIMVELSLPWFNWLTDRDLYIAYGQDVVFWQTILLILISVGLLSGIYPAFFLSSFSPVSIFRGNSLHAFPYTTFRKVLVVFQFSLSIVLLISTWVIYEQLSFVRAKDLGYDREHTLMLRNFNTAINSQFDDIKRDLEAHPQISSVASADFQLGEAETNTSGFRAERADGSFREIMADLWAVDEDFIRAMGLKLKQGRDFILAKDSSNRGAIVNQAYVEHLGLKNPLGKAIFTRLGADSTNRKARIVGVMEDLHIASLRTRIRPTVFLLNPTSANIYLRLSGRNMPETLQYIRKVWQRYETRYPYKAQFVEENFEQRYQEDQKRGQVFLAFSLLSIFVACLGLLGLSTFITKQKSKEIGIRKILGASLADILRLIARDFLPLILLAALIAVPVAYYVSEQWLASFAYRASPNPLAFILPIIFVLLLALLSVAWQALKTAKLNPAEVLTRE